MRCPHCGKEVKELCSICWRCKDCPVDCSDHMRRVMNGKIGTTKDKKPNINFLS